MTKEKKTKRKKIKKRKRQNQHLKRKKRKKTDQSSPRYSPAVVRIAQERGIDLNDVPGSGKNGRITRKDIKNFDPATVESSSEDHAKPEETKEKVEETSAKAKESTSSVASQETPKQEGNKTYLPVDGVRRAIANNMTKSKSEIPHAWVMVEADVSNIVKLRNSMKEKFAKQEGTKLSFFPFFVKAVAQALKDNPLLNSSWDEKNIILHHDINISIAVATEDHLYVPVIKNADNYSVAGIAKEINRLAEKARNGSLSSEDMSGGTITVNNTGSFGSVQSMGIINHPQAAILQVEAIQEKILPVDNGFKTAHMANLSLSIDHRILDGLQSGKFLKDVKKNLAQYNDEANVY
ncbi:dihydrolipoamide acetyltransferase family protein [Tetragenococcus halophilus]